MSKRLMIITILTFGGSLLAGPSSAELSCGNLWNDDDPYCSLDGVILRPSDEGFNPYVFRCLKPDTATRKIVACSKALHGDRVSPSEALHIYSARADAYLEEGQVDSALSDLDTVVEMEPTAHRFKERGDAWLEKPEFTSAIQDYSKAIKLDVSNPEYHAARARAYFKVSNWERAIADMKGAARLNPKNHEYQRYLGIAYREMGNYPAAAEAFTFVIEVSPDAEVYNDRAMSYLAQKDFGNSIADAGQAIDLKPAEYLSWCIRGMAYFGKAKARFVPYLASEDFQRSAEDLSEAIRLNPEDILAYTFRARVYEEIGKEAEAVSDWQKVLELDTEHQEAQIALTRLGGRVAQ